MGSYYQNTLQNGLEKTLTSSTHFLIETMSNKSTKSVSSKRPNQKGMGSPNPDIKIVDTSRTTSRGTSLIGAEPVEEVHPQYTNEPLRMRIEYKEGTEDIKFKLNKKRKYESKTYPWHESDQFKQEICTIGEFIDKIKKECPNARIEILPQSCEEECFEFFINDKPIYSVRLLKDWPNFDEIYECVYWLYRGKTFQHIYMCTYMVGINVGVASQVMGCAPTTMTVYDRKHTPLYKRVMLSCSIM